MKSHFIVKKSQIPGAGLGLYTTKNIPKGIKIVEYKGRLERWSDVKDQDGHNGYLLQINARWAIDALPYKRSPGRYANDASGINRVIKLRNNAEYILKGKRCFIYAKRNILEGEEILVSYGRAYWNLNRKLNKKKQTKLEN